VKDKVVRREEWREEETAAKEGVGGSDVEVGEK